jgi:hypothetical protein
MKHTALQKGFHLQEAGQAQQSRISTGTQAGEYPQAEENVVYKVGTVEEEQSNSRASHLPPRDREWEGELQA